ncbi:MAG: phospholipid carrier-dependent glycosyltransferase [archaeon]
MKKTRKNTNKPKTTQTQKTGKIRPQEDSVNHFYWILLIIIIVSGLYFRTVDYALEGIKGDAPLILAAGLLWFYPHDFHPSLMQYNPTVPNYLIASGCMLSGEDFSAISNAKPFFIPNIPALIGRPYAAAENYCFIPVYIASILVFLGLITFSLIMLNKKVALFAIAFFAYNPTLLSMGRNIYTWVFVWMVSIYGIIVFWKYYDEKKGSKKELIYAAITGAIFGIALGTKFTLALFFLFSIFLIIEKYKDNIKKETLKIPIPLIKSMAIFLIIYSITAMIPFEMNPKNFYDTYHAMTTYQEGADIKLSTGTLGALAQILPNFNIIDTLLFLYSIFIFYTIAKKKDKTKKEKYLLYYIILFLLSTTFIGNVLGGTRSLPFFFGIPILMALAFSDKEYSIFSKLKIDHSKRTQIIYAIIIIYIILSIFTLYPIKPYYQLRTNTITCTIINNSFCNPLPYPYEKKIDQELAKILKEKETFYIPSTYTGEGYFYIRQDDYYYIWLLKEYIKKQYNIKPSIYDIIMNFNVDNRTIKYIVLIPNTPVDEEKRIIETTTPTKVLEIKNIPVAYIYDVDTLPEIKKYRESQPKSQS